MESGAQTGDFSRRLEPEKFLYIFQSVTRSRRSQLRVICATPIGKHVFEARSEAFFCCVCKDVQ
jgi:hypothetical protein